jgi:flavin-dependent dehydrogenase
LGTPDVLVVGAGPAGSVAGLLLARAGVRVRIVDRATFPRDKLCGDTINPGTLARFRALGVADGIERRGARVGGMIVTGARGDAVQGRYPAGAWGCAILRRDLDALLLDQAMAAGCQFDSRVVVSRALRADGRIVGVALGGCRHESRIMAPVTIAADGRRSAIAFELGAATHPVRPRRWAVGAYYHGVAPFAAAAEGAAVFGEMHIRRGRYVGVAPVAPDLTNVCLVKPSMAADDDLRDPAELLSRTVNRDPWLRERFANGTLVTRPVVLGPLAVEARPPALDGLLFAGDAAGFVDPMTGDGLRFAVRGAELAAAAALEALVDGWAGVHPRLAAARRREFASKYRFNRVLRALVGSPSAIDLAAYGVRIAPWTIRALIARAGDCA